MDDDPAGARPTRGVLLMPKRYPTDDRVFPADRVFPTDTARAKDSISRKHSIWVGFERSGESLPPLGD